MAQFKIATTFFFYNSGNAGHGKLKFGMKLGNLISFALLRFRRVRGISKMLPCLFSITLEQFVLES